MAAHIVKCKHRLTRPAIDDERGTGPAPPSRRLSLLANIMARMGMGRSSLGDQLAHLARSEDYTGRLFVRCSFEVRCENTLFGDTVVIAGSTEQFGSWRPERGLRLTTDEQSFPIWRCEPLLRAVNADEEIEYKFVIVRGDGSHAWEPLGANRRLILPTDVDSLNLVADWGVATTWSMGPPPSSSSNSMGSSSATPRGSGGTHHDVLASPTGVRPPAPTPMPLSSGSEGEVDPSLNERLLVVTQHLPLKISRGVTGGWQVEWDESSVLTTSVQGGRHLLGGLNLETIWIGVPRCDVSREEEAELATFLERFNCKPVWLRGVDLSDFASNVLWPILHNQLPDRHAGGRGGDGSVVPAMWKAYEHGNEAYAATVRATWRCGDLVWVQSYHLLLLPGKLREVPKPSSADAPPPKPPPSCIISLFLHTPFPSPEIWRVLPYRIALLEGTQPERAEPRTPRPERRAKSA